MMEGYVPVFAFDRTVIGKAKIKEDGRHVEISLDFGEPIAEFLAEGLLGFSMVALAGIPWSMKDEIEKENKSDDD